MKYILILYMCSTITGQCPTSSIPGYHFTNHYDCVTTGYRVAHNTFLNLKELEEFDRDYIERERISVKFECKPIQAT